MRGNFGFKGKFLETVVIPFPVAMPSMYIHLTVLFDNSNLEFIKSVFYSIVLVVDRVLKTSHSRIKS